LLRCVSWVTVPTVIPLGNPSPWYYDGSGCRGRLFVSTLTSGESLIFLWSYLDQEADPMIEAKLTLPKGTGDSTGYMTPTQCQTVAISTGYERIPLQY